jgi:protein-disulfide isomerase
LQDRYGPEALKVVVKQIGSHPDEALALGVRTIPTLFVNGRRIDGPADAQSLSRLLDLAFGKLLSDQPITLNLEKAPRLAAATATANTPEIVVFSDFQCPFCASLAAVLAELAQAGEAVIRFKHFPLSFHAKAPAAHRAALAANQQGKFWEMHDLIFGGGPGKLEPTILETYAKDLGLDLTQFQKDSAPGSAVDAAIQADLAEGEKVGVEGTPTILVNGRQFLSKPTSANLRTALQQSKGASTTLPTVLPSLTLLDGPAHLPVLEWFFDAHSQLTASSAADLRRLLERESSRTGGTRVRIIARHLPMTFHSGSKLTHQALALAGEQGKFWAFLDLVNSAIKQNAGSVEPIDTERLKSIAMRAGLDTAQFTQRLDQGAAAAAVERDLARARELQVRGVPAIVLDGKLVDTQTDDFETLLTRGVNLLPAVATTGGAKLP